MTLEEMKDQARQLANAAFCNNVLPCVRIRQGIPSCLVAEENRKLSLAEKRKGWHKRPFCAYNMAYLCLGCRAYWYQEMAAEALHDVWCLSVKFP